MYQIFEQILPYFNPSVSVAFQTSRNAPSVTQDDIVLTLSDVSTDEELELTYREAYDLQLHVKTLTFTTELTYYGPLTSSNGVIKTTDVRFVDGATGKGLSRVILQVDPYDAESSSYGISEGVFLLDDDFNVITSATLGTTGLLC
jgi:hypothetical protein